MEQDVRAVVLGWQKSDKASVINSILGVEVASDEYFVKSVSKSAEVNGRKITLINTPCWWEIFGLQDSPEVVKQELVCSVFECPPGPHVFLLVINLSLPFTEENRLSIEKHFSLFGERIWRHTIVLFTRADSLKDKYTEQRGKNQDLQQIIQRCGERYHIFENENKSDGVQELLIKIDEVVAANNGKHFETCDEMLQGIRKKRKENEERAKDTQEMLKDKRKLMEELISADEKLMEQLRREGSRWEAIIMDGLLNILQNPEASHGGNMSQSSNEMVLRWLQKCEEHSTSKTSSADQHNPETSDNTSKLQIHSH